MADTDRTAHKEPPPGSMYWTHLKKTPIYYGRNLYREIITRNVFLWGQVIAFKVLIATVPVIVLVTGILDLVPAGRRRVFCRFQFVACTAGASNFTMVNTGLT